MEQLLKKSEGMWGECHSKKDFGVVWSKKHENIPGQFYLPASWHQNSSKLVRKATLQALNFLKCDHNAQHDSS